MRRVRAFGVGWVVAAALTACGGRATEKPGLGTSIGGSSAGGSAHVTGGSGGAGGGSVDPRLLSKYCGVYCHELFRVCPNGVAGSPGECAAQCVNVSQTSEPGCAKAMFDMLDCALSAAFGDPAIRCVDLPWSFGGKCSGQIDALQNCGLSLPGAEYCTTTTGFGTDTCDRVSRCGSSVFYETHCEFNPSVGLSSCACTVDGEPSYERIYDSLTEVSCGVAAAMACGPNLQ